MSGLRQVLIGFLVVLLAGLIIIGVMTLSSSRPGQETSAAPSQTRQETPENTKAVTQMPTASPTINVIPSDDFPVTIKVSSTPIDKAAATQTPGKGTTEPQTGEITATPVVCGGDEEYNYYSMLPGAFLEDTYTSSIVIIQDQPEPTPTATEQTISEKSKSCTKPRGWVAYTVRRGDTLSQLSRWTGVSIAKLKKVNCMGASNKLKAGKKIYIPRASYIPRMAPPVWRPVPPPIYPPSWYVPSKDPKPVQPTRPVIIITMPPDAPNAAIPDTPELSGIDYALSNKLGYNATHF
ncbi:MAG: LysM peptidoglycan-binding domain-containing protein [Anaerolineales bacterium]|nr:LysM peptidoglycan-binding domain-containing protein [Anaerolineales bacterium]